MKLSRVTSKTRAFSPSERSSVRILLVEPDAAEREGARTALKSLGFTSLFSSSDLVGSLKSIQEREISHVIFSIHKQNCSPVGFIKDALSKNSKLIMMTSSSARDLSNILEYLRIGARGFLVKPATAELLEQTLLSATRGEGLSQVILESTNRNEVISAVLAAGIDKLSVAQQAHPENMATSVGDVSMASLRNLLKVALASSDGGPPFLNRCTRV